VRQDHPRRIVLTIPELVVVLGFLAYGVGALAFVVFGPMFFAWMLTLAVVATPFALYAKRRRQRRLSRLRAARRRTRLATRTEPWFWEEAA
jgi:hypothetical protein